MIDRNRMYSAREVLSYLPKGYGRSTFYRLCQKKVIPAIPLGRRLCIPGWWLADLLSKPKEIALQGK